MNTPPVYIGLFFNVMGVFFLGLAARDYVKKGAMSTPARKAWLRIRGIFTGEGIFLYVFHTYFLPRPREGGDLRSLGHRGPYALNVVINLLTYYRMSYNSGPEPAGGWGGKSVLKEAPNGRCGGPEASSQPGTTA